jgi:uncharacterized protein YoxC
LYDVKGLVETVKGLVETVKGLVETVKGLVETRRAVRRSSEIRVSPLIVVLHSVC